MSRPRIGWYADAAAGHAQQLEQLGNSNVLQGASQELSKLRGSLADVEVFLRDWAMPKAPPIQWSAVMPRA